MAIDICYLFPLHFVTMYFLQRRWHVGYPAVKSFSLQQLGWTKAHARLAASEQGAVLTSPSAESPVCVCDTNRAERPLWGGFWAAAPCCDPLAEEGIWVCFPMLSISRPPVTKGWCQVRPDLLGSTRCSPWPRGAAQVSPGCDPAPGASCPALTAGFPLRGCSPKPNGYFKHLKVLFPWNEQYSF